MLSGLGNINFDTVQKLKEVKEHRQKQERDDLFTVLAKRVEHLSSTEGTISAIDFERILGRNDLLPINYLEKGVMAARAVARIYASDLLGSGGDWGTGFLVSPRLLLTNNHVLPSSDVAARSFAEFDYEIGINGRPRQPKRFQFTPQLGFITDPSLDLTLVAVDEVADDGSTELSAYSLLRLMPALHKVEELAFVTIIQHPDSEYKYIAIRENEVIKIGQLDGIGTDNYLWYVSDTAPGSSGAPVFNDSWQVVAIHHRGVPETRQSDGVLEYQRVTGEWIPKEQAERLKNVELKWVANEGVRVSKIIAKIDEIHTMHGNMGSPFVQELLDDAHKIKPFPNTTGNESVVWLETDIESDLDTLEKKRKGRPKKSPKPIPDFSPPPKKGQNSRPLSYYTGREGYAPNFLGVVIPLPTLTAKALAFGEVADVKGTTDNVLHYTHFSVVINATRRLAFYTAVNIDGKQWSNLSRDNDSWFYDPRISADLQVANDFYSNEGVKGGNYFDRGHLVRRLDPVWGSMEVAALANSDTFHWTNCAPQYWAFNQGQELWQGLENYILYNTDEEDVKASVFTGPVFQNEDEVHREVLIPQYYWKVVLVTNRTGKLYSSAYIVSQQQYAVDIPFERLPVGEFMNFQVSVTKLEQLTGLSFPNNVRSADVMPSAENRPLKGLGDVINPRRR